MSDAEYKQAVVIHTLLENRKLRLLMQHYEVAIGDYRSLAFELAREFIVGFDGGKTRGRPPKWDMMALGYLYVDVERKIIELGVDSRRTAPEKVYRAVAAMRRWKYFLEKASGDGITPDPSEAIRKAYQQAKKDNWRKIAWDAYLYSAENDALDEWENEISDHLKMQLDSTRK